MGIPETVFAILLVGFGLLELLAPIRAAPRRRRWLGNAGITVATLLVLPILPASLITAAAWAQARDIGALNALALPTAAAVVATLLARSFLSWAVHLANHKVPLLWRLHRVHHLDPELDVSTTARFHPLELVVGLAIGAPFVIALGLDPWTLLVYEVLDAAVNVFSHANLRLPQRLERAIGWLIVTPAVHRIHHSSWQPETDSNYGAVFPIWDQLLGTRRTVPREPLAEMRLGLDEVRDERTAQLGWLLASPFLDLTSEASAARRRAGSSRR